VSLFSTNYDHGLDMRVSNTFFKVVGNEKGVGSGGWLLSEDGFTP
jgi:hypothetical protein